MVDDGQHPRSNSLSHASKMTLHPSRARHAGRTRLGDATGLVIGTSTYLALPRQEVSVGPAPVEGNQEVGAVVPVCHGKLGVAHLLAGRLCRPTSAESSLGKGWSSGSSRRGMVIASSCAMVSDSAIVTV